MNLLKKNQNDYVDSNELNIFNMLKHQKSDPQMQYVSFLKKEKRHNDIFDAFILIVCD